MRAAAVLLVLLLAGCTAPPQPTGPTGLRCLACPVVVEGADSLAFETAVAWNPSDPRHVVAAAMEQGSDGLAWLVVHPSFDGGATWEAVRIPGGPSADPGHPLAAATRMADPSVLILEDGTVLLGGFAVLGTPPPASTGINVTGGTTQSFVARSTDGGRTFPDIALLGAQGQRASTLGDPTFDAARERTELPRLSLGAGSEVFFAWSRGDGGQLAAQDQDVDLGYAYDLLLARSRDAGRTWDDLGEVLSDGALIGPTVASDGAGGIWVAVHDQAAAEVLLARSTDDGRTWQVGPAALGVAPYLPQVRWVEGSLILAYAALGEDGTQVPALRRSTDGAGTWEPPILLDQPGTPGRALVAMAALADGTIVVSYIHTLGEEQRELRAVALRPDGQRVGPLVLDPAVGDVAPRGEYHGIAARGNEAFVAWSHRSGELMDLWGARVALG